MCRPKQWIKNGFVLAALIFSKSFFQGERVLEAFSAMISFCLISSVIYIINDLSDIEKDKLHPVKKNRPLASGKVKKWQGVVTAGILLVAAVCFSALIDYRVVLTIVVYGVVNILYTFKLKKVAILDVMCIAFGFILRVAAGAFAIDVVISKWIIICTGLLSLYLGFGKRKNELYLLQEGAKSHRSVLEQYDKNYLDRIVLMFLGLTTISYILYCVDVSNNMIATIPFVIYGTLRYEMLLTMKNKGGAPEEVFLQDKPFLVNIVLWLIVSMVVVGI